MPEFAEILKDLKLSEFISLDIETTGLDYLCDEIIEFGGLKYVDGKPCEKLNLLIKPSKPIPEYITQLTGICNKMVENSPTFSQVSEQILEFIGNLPVVAHNIVFDLSFLEYFCRNVRGVNLSGERINEYLVIPNEKYDTLVLAKTFLHFLAGFSLSDLKKYFEIEVESSHRALPDAQAAGEIFLKLLNIALLSEFRDIRKICEILEPTDEPIRPFFLNLLNFLATGKYHFPQTLDKEFFIYSTHFYNIIGEDEIPEQGKLETNSIRVETIRDFFNVGGALEENFGIYELRDSQKQMAEAVARAFNQMEFLVVEAGTGTGKSMAYLLPAIRWGIQNYGPFGRTIISTNTKNLQEQLFFKDIPILHSILKEKFKVVLLKGKGNYLCLDKWDTILKDMQFRLSVDERIHILSLYFWIKHTETGDISENNAFRPEKNMGLWSKFIAENNYCPAKNCKHYHQCFLMRARNNARDAHLVLVNHSLLFSDLSTNQAILSEYTNVILDEAHNIERVATEYLGVEISLWNFRDVFRKLYQKEQIETGILAQMKKRIQLSDMDAAKKELVMGHLDRIISRIDKGWPIIQGFFKELTIQLRYFLPETENIGYSNRIRYQRDTGLIDKMEPYFIEAIGYIKEILYGINDLIELLKDIPENSFNFQKQIYQELQAQFSQMDDLKNNLDFLIKAEWDNWVYWFELPNRDSSSDSRLYGAPLNISEILSEKFYSNLNTAIFTSATLTVGQSFEYFLHRVGLDRVPRERLETLALSSPFNYEKQVLLAVPAFFPDPRAVEFKSAVESFIEQLVREQKRGTLVLFTSYSMLNNLYGALRSKFDTEKVQIFAQGKSGSRHAIINQFKENTESYLFGTDSFWEGIDVPGQALEILLIAKLPFDVPSDPVVQAKADMIRKKNGNPFMEYTVPEAVIKFRQGFGRLIRHRNDYGAVIILDNRVVKKMYGRMFLQSLPVKAHLFHSPDELWEELFKWFKNKSPV
jgi:predicted DnaQ family exonuclease/DinG family helicase